MSSPILPSRAPGASPQAARPAMAQTRRVSWVMRSGAQRLLMVLGTLTVLWVASHAALG